MAAPFFVFDRGKLAFASVMCWLVLTSWPAIFAPNALVLPLNGCSTSWPQMQSNCGLHSSKCWNEKLWFFTHGDSPMLDFKRNLLLKQGSCGDVTLTVDSACFWPKLLTFAVFFLCFSVFSFLPSFFRCFINFCSFFSHFWSIHFLFSFSCSLMFFFYSFSFCSFFFVFFDIFLSTALLRQQFCCGFGANIMLCSEEGDLGLSFKNERKQSLGCWSLVSVPMNSKAVTLTSLSFNSADNRWTPGAAIFLLCKQANFGENLCVCFEEGWGCRR
jgi:hypothetical protein